MKYIFLISLLVLSACASSGKNLPEPKTVMAHNRNFIAAPYSISIGQLETSGGYFVDKWEKESFYGAVEKALKAKNLLADQENPYILNAKILDMDEQISIADTIFKSVVTYTVVDTRTNAVVFRDTITMPCTISGSLTTFIVLATVGMEPPAKSDDKAIACALEENALHFSNIITKGTL